MVKFMNIHYKNRFEELQKKLIHSFEHLKFVLYLNLICINLENMKKIKKIF